MNEQQTPVDPRIGIHGQYQPSVCAGTGQSVDGRHFTTISLGNGYYCRVLNKWTGDRQALKRELQARLPKRALNPAPKSIVSEGKSDDQ